MGNTPEMVPHVMSQDATMPQSATLVLFVCTNGFLMKRNVMAAIMAIGETQVTFVPLLAEENFRFPGRSFSEDHYEIAESVAEPACVDPDFVLDLAVNLFTGIAVLFQPGHYSNTEMILATKAHEIYTRCTQESVLKRLSSRISANYQSVDGVVRKSRDASRVSANPKKNRGCGGQQERRYLARLGYLSKR